jgi:hypothetical protein
MKSKFFADTKLAYKDVIKFLIALILFTCNLNAYGMIKGIYITQGNAENSAFMQRLIPQAKQAGINTFVIDYGRYSKRYVNSIALVKRNGIKYVVRITMFPGGGTHEQITSLSYWERHNKLIQDALSFGANGVQLDYIRYTQHQLASPQNVQYIHKVIKWINARIPTTVSLQIDVFGETSYIPSQHIGQDVRVFAPTIDVLCPMVYPTHYFPWQKHTKNPYFIINYSLKHLREQFAVRPPFQIVPFIEMSNFRIAQSSAQKQWYINEELRAVYDNHSDGFYAWSAHNEYQNLFQVLRNSKRY